MRLAGRVAWVTGGGSGIGRAISERFAAEGARVAVNDLVPESAKETALRLPGQGHIALAGDVSDSARVAEIADEIAKSCGRIDVLVNNAGVELSAAFPKYTREELTSMVDVNLTAPMLLTHRVLPGMLERGRGHVVFISSVAGLMYPAYVEPYAATKAGLVGLARSLRAEYGDSPVGFTAVCPGFVKGDGMYHRMKEQGFKSNFLMGETTIEKVARRVVRAIKRDMPLVVEAGTPVRPAMAIGNVSPRMLDRIINLSRSKQLFGAVAKDRGRL
jgi:NAD(P)-dependent dehydrogenase (short-subunit alcohol dehydrogenase family)